MALVATILGGASLSDACELGAHRFAGILFPSNWDAAPVTFQVSPDGQEYVEARMSDGQTSSDVTIAQADIVAGRANLFVGDLSVAMADIRSFKIRSGTLASPVNQGDAVALKIFLVPR